MGVPNFDYFDDKSYDNNVGQDHPKLPPQYPAPINPNGQRERTIDQPQYDDDFWQQLNLRNYWNGPSILCLSTIYMFACDQKFSIWLWQRDSNNIWNNLEEKKTKTIELIK